MATEQRLDPAGERPDRALEKGKSTSRRHRLKRVAKWSATVLTVVAAFVIWAIEDDVRTLASLRRIDGTQAELTRIATELARSTSGDGIVWIAYPKKTSKRFKCEFNRDSGDWSVLGNAGFEPVRQVAIDEDWSALRFRRTEYIQALTRQNSMAISEEGKRRTN
ncbi:MAG: hypothetical protein KDA60_11110 [Planctomycetales bacterium]|nr:hypothetical protein [Planctomycetales bacterium]